MAGSSRSRDADALVDAVAEEVRSQRLDSLRGPDSPEGREMGKVFGANVATLRRERGIDLETVAERSGIRVDLLEKLEDGMAVPSLRAIWHLATALQVPFGSLLANTLFAETSNVDFRVQTAERGRVIADAANSFRSRVLFPEGDPRSPEVYELTLMPGCVENAEPHAPGTYEHIVVVSGSLCVRAGEKEATLGPGDALLFCADVEHGYENRGGEVTVAHLVMRYEPDAK